MGADEDIPGRLGELIRFGTVKSVDLAAGRCVVEAGDVETAPIRWIEGRAGATRTWSPPTIGEQVLLLAADTELEGAVALRGIASTAFPPAGTTLRELIRFSDGAEIAYDPETHVLEATLPAGGTATIDADGGILLMGDVTIMGAVEIGGAVNATGDVVGAGISLQNHVHGNVQSGGSQTGAPQ